MKRILIAAAVLMLCVHSVFADTTAEIMDPDREISLTVHLEEEGAVSDVGVTIYRVADVSVYTGAASDVQKGVAVYESLVGDVDYDGMSARENAAAAELLSEEDLEDLISYSATTDKNGDAVFRDLEKGAYLVTQTSGTDVYVFDPFIAFAPLCGEDAVWTYQVTCSPKIAAAVVTEETVRTMAPQTGDGRYVRMLISAGMISAAAVSAGWINSRRRKGEIRIR